MRLRLWLDVRAPIKTLAKNSILILTKNHANFCWTNADYKFDFMLWQFNYCRTKRKNKRRSIPNNNDESSERTNKQKITFCSVFCYSLLWNNNLRPPNHKWTGTACIAASAIYHSSTTNDGTSKKKLHNKINQRLFVILPQQSAHSAQNIKRTTKKCMCCMFNEDIVIKLSQAKYCICLIFSHILIYFCHSRSARFREKCYHFSLPQNMMDAQGAVVARWNNSEKNRERSSDDDRHTELKWWKKPSIGCSNKTKKSMRCWTDVSMTIAMRQDWS